jgi:hypothetical protein
MQQGRYAGKLIHRRVSGQTCARLRSVTSTKGTWRSVGKGFAVLQSGPIKDERIFRRGCAWAAIHLQFLATQNLRVSVFVQVGVDVSDRPARLSPDCESPRSRTGSSGGSKGCDAEKAVCRINDLEPRAGGWLDGVLWRNPKELSTLT